VVEESEDLTFYNCPSLFVPVNIVIWFEKYCYEKEFGTNIKYEDRSNRFIEAMQQYRVFESECADQKRPQKIDGITKVRQSWQKRSS